ncbi:MAG: S8 family serine peptidase, partial [bacterium]|nr:S8 family serine peptidase [bacterium]
MNKVNKNKIQLKQYLFFSLILAAIFLAVVLSLAQNVVSSTPAWLDPWAFAYPNFIPWTSTPLVTPLPAYSPTPVPHVQSPLPAGSWLYSLFPPEASLSRWSAATSPLLSPLSSLLPAEPTGLDTAQFRYGPPAAAQALNYYIPGQPNYVAGQVLVTFWPGTPMAEIARVYATHQCREIYASPYAGYKLLAIPSYVPAPEMARRLSLEPSVLYASPNLYRYANFIPNDPYYTYQWHLPRLNCSYAWDFSTGIGALVALLDSGVAYQTVGVYAKAPDLAGTLFVPGYDFVNLDAYPNDDYGHGTHMAGCIAQTTNNLLGVAGV